MKRMFASACRQVCGGLSLPRRPRRAALRRIAAPALVALWMQASGCAGPQQATIPASTSPAVASLESPEVHLSQSPVAVLFRGTHPRHAVILIAGIYNNHQYFLPWQESLARDEVVLLGWQRAHHGQRLDDSALLLAAELLSLQEQGIRNVTLIAHSIGGLVAKGALDHLSREQLYYRFDAMELHAFGTPWGGFPGADLAHGNLLGQLVSYLAGNPVWLDLGTQSAYLAGLAQPMPPNGQLFNYMVEDDEVARPASEASVQRYQALLRHVTASLQVPGADHNAYVLHRLDGLMTLAKKEGLPGAAMWQAVQDTKDGAVGMAVIEATEAGALSSGTSD